LGRLGFPGPAFVCSWDGPARKTPAIVILGAKDKG
jgi:hypothetical protein